MIKILGPRKDAVTVEWRKVHIEKLTQYCSGDQIEKSETFRAYNTYGGEVYTGFWLET